ncbi:MAG: hypothetical protein M5U25_09905 [Planctomycetota bacterium]|nr:hypothetical protein [Planctomycetota bacterium]
MRLVRVPLRWGCIEAVLNSKLPITNFQLPATANVVVHEGHEESRRAGPWLIAFVVLRGPSWFPQLPFKS